MYSGVCDLRYGIPELLDAFDLIKEENYDVFKETIGSRVEQHINVEYCFQKNDNIPEGYKLPEDRVKPLGTSHALYCAKDKVNENNEKIIINLKNKGFTINEIIETLNVSKDFVEKTLAK